MKNKVFLNDKMVEADKAKISVSDSGLLYGLGVFETMRACNGKVFALDSHLERLLTRCSARLPNRHYLLGNPVYIDLVQCKSF